MKSPTRIATLWAVLAGLYFLVWLPLRADQIWFQRLNAAFPWWITLSSLPLGLLWLVWAVRKTRQPTASVSFSLSVLYVVWWQLAVAAADALAWDVLRTNLARYGAVGLFLIGLSWVIWLVDRASWRIEAQRLARRLDAPLDISPLALSPAARYVADDTRPIWNPLDPAAWYYGRRAGKLNQSLAVFITYAGLFLVLFLVLAQLRGCQELYEMPAGGGQQKALAQTVRVKKIIRKKFVVNPYSVIRFDVPPIDEVKLQLEQATEHAYTVGYGEGTGAGFGGGAARGKVRLIRLEYSGGDWDHNFGIGADLNMLIEYGIRTSHPVAEKTESRPISQLRNFPAGKSPPLVYMTGQKSISLSNSEVKVLREYLVRKHGMLFGDNGGSRHFHNQFLAMMGQVLPDVRPVPVPLDDVIHRIPYPLPFLPYVSPHGGKEALGWWQDGRWLCYYHPGDIADAWRDDHSGVKAEIWEGCYQLGTNIIFYAHSEYSKWLESQNRER